MKKLTHDEISVNRSTLTDIHKVKRIPVYVLLNSIRSNYNVGSIFRTSDGVMIEKLFLCGYTPHPPITNDVISKDTSRVESEKSKLVDHTKDSSSVEAGFGMTINDKYSNLVISSESSREKSQRSPGNKEVLKTALGATESVKWEYVKEAKEVILKLKSEGIKICALEQTSKSRPYYDINKSDFPLCLIVGNEITGVSQELIDLCDFSIEIPQFGIKQSLNVAVAYGIAVFELRKIYEPF